MSDAHAPFIIASYLATVVIVGGLILRLVLDHRAQKRALAALEERGAGRGRRAAAPSREIA